MRVHNILNPSTVEVASSGMASCEPHRTKAYSDDLRWRMVWQKEVLDYTYKDISLNLNVDLSTVWRVVKLFRETGSVSKKVYPRERAFRKLTAPLELTIIHLVLSRPGIYLREIQEELCETMGAEISPSAICRFLHKVGFSRQRMKLVALQRDKEIRAQFVSDVSIYEPDMLIFLDETGADRRDSLRKYGYSLRGRPVHSQKLLVRGDRISAIAFMSVNGFLDCHTVRGTVNTEVFLEFVAKTLLPHLMPFDGRNPHSVVIMDNCIIHHGEEVVQMIQEVGALVHFLPPYPPDYDPIEEAFSKVKSELKAMEREGQVTDLETLLLAAFSSISPQDCQQWIKHPGIYNYNI